MAQPATGVSWEVSGLSLFDVLRIRRGGRWAVLIRDYDGANTDISPYGTFGSPMALDGTWRDDLLAVVKDSNGDWVYNNQANEGFYKVGCLHPDGIERAPSIDVDNLPILQSIDPARIDQTGREMVVRFTPRENHPLTHCIRYNLPLADVLDPGSGTYFAGESADTVLRERQIIIVHEDLAGGQAERMAIPMSRGYLTSVGAAQGNRTDPDESQFEFTRVLDPYFVDADGAGLVDGVWVAGAAWDAGLTPGLTFTQTAPVAVTTGATSADITFSVPLGGTTPYAYSAESSADGETGWTSATDDDGSVSSGVVTLGISSLTTATEYYFRVTVTDDDANTAVSKVTNAITTD